MKLQILLFLILVCGCCHAVTVTGAGNSCAANTTCNEGAAFTAVTGDDIVLGCFTSQASTHTTPSDSGTNTYTQIGSTTTYGTGSRGSLWRATNITGFVSGHVACNTATAASGIVVTYTRVSGLTIRTVDADAAITTPSSASPWASGTLVTTNANDYIVTIIANDAVAHTFTAPTGFTISATQSTNVAMAYQAVTSTQNTTYSWTGTGTTDHMFVGVTSLQNIGPSPSTQASPFVIGL